jgi:excinuclease ABC subunit C
MVDLFDAARLAHYPESPGVYLMKDDRGVVLYIGKAKNLKARLKQYYAPSSSDERVQIPYLLSKVVDIETVLTLSEKEALVLESTLIKRFQPKYNVLLKDDKSRLLLRIGLEHRWPRIEYVRSKDASELLPQVFGPYIRPYAARELFDLTVRLFLLRQCTNDEFRRRTSPCLLYQMRRCTAPCVGKVTKEEYDAQVASAMDFLSGKTKVLREKLHAEMERASAALEFEKAGQIFRRLQLLDAVSEVRYKHSVAGASDTDVIGNWQEGDRFALAILHYRGSSLVYGESWVFHIEGVESFPDLLEQLLVQYYLHRSAIDGVPKEILFPEGGWSLEALGDLVHDHFGVQVRLRRPEIGAKSALVALACDNARARLSQSPESQGYDLHSLDAIQHLLSLRRFPRIIDCFDASHFGGKGLVAASIGFVDGKKAPGRYRKFHIRDVHVGDDLSMLKEAIRRRYKNMDETEELPDLILIDGGREHLRAALDALEALSFLDVDVASIAKEHGRHDKGMTSEVLFVRNGPPLSLPITSHELLFLQTIRDEAHRFTITFQKQQRVKAVLSSQLDAISGIGPKKRHKLLTAFQGIEAIRRASVQELQEKASLSQKDAQRVSDALH